LRRDGVIANVNVWTELLYDANGKVSGILSLLVDSSEKLKLEQQLRLAQRLEAVGQLAGGVAHDFNNLLTIISGHSDLALSQLDAEDPVRNNIEEVLKASHRASALTTQLLAFSRRQVLKPKVLDLNLIVADLEKMMRRLIGENIDLITILKTGIGFVKADPGQLEQVIVNLVLNARDAMPEGGKLIIETFETEIDSHYTSQHVGTKLGSYVAIGVSDTGHGMDAETQAHIFEPFFTTRELGKGTGLGLSTVYGIVKQSGGNIWVYSEPGYGTTFKIYLPLVPQTSDPFVTRPVRPSVVGGSETILLVEDEERVCALVREVLAKQGYTVLSANNGEEGLALSRREPRHIDLLLTDVVMPRMSGRELAENLVRERTSLKVLFMSGYTDKLILHKGMLEPNTHFLQKPFSPDEIARKVREVLDGQEQE
jgi:two-component system cell cycle sensor histidine kinase/response regulator CckA